MCGQNRTGTNSRRCKMDRLKISKRYPSYQDAVGLGGEAVEFEWTIFQGFTTLTILKEFQKERGRTSSQNTSRIFMSMFNDIEWKENDENCISNAEKVKNYSKRFL